MTLYENIKKLLDENTIPYKEFEHEAVKTCEDSAKAREGIEGIGSKNILFKASKSGRYFLCVTRADREKVGKKEFRPLLGEKDFRFANAEELWELLHAESGYVAPLGQPEDFLTLVDKTLFDYEYFLFNPGTHTATIQVKTDDLKQLYDKLYSNVLYFE